MKSKTHLLILVVAVLAVVGFYSQSAAASNVDVSLGVNAGLSHVHLGCDGCSDVAVKRQTSVGVALRAFYPVVTGLDVGGELALEKSYGANARVAGENVGDIKGHAWSIMPMVRTRAYSFSLYAGLGVAQPYTRISDIEGGGGDSASDRAAFISKVGADYRVYGPVSVYAEWEYLHAHFNKLEFKESRNTGSLGAAYHF